MCSQCVSCTETEVEILLKFYVFLPAGLCVSFHGWISDPRSREVNPHSHNTASLGLNSTASIEPVSTASIVEKFWGMCGLSGGCKFLSGWRWRAECVMEFAGGNPSFVLLKPSADVKRWRCLAGGRRGLGRAASARSGGFGGVLAVKKTPFRWLWPRGVYAPLRRGANFPREPSESSRRRLPQTRFIAHLAGNSLCPPPLPPNAEPPERL